MTHLITGGARSGKSRHAEHLAIQHDGPVRYLATAEVRDEEFAERVRQHRLQRPAHWQVLEAERGLAADSGQDQEDGLLLVDCLGMWLMRFFAVTTSLTKWISPGTTVAAGSHRCSTGPVAAGDQ
jgi:adenosylcobinamide kinase/adenosylcobinamide-phosphate guanylyltransferase